MTQERQHGRRAFAIILSLSGFAAEPAFPDQPPGDADSTAIASLLDTYASAVSRKDQASFETLLLGTDIPFAYVPDAPIGGDPPSWRDYAGFRRAVFEGPPFT